MELGQHVSETHKKDKQDPASLLLIEQLRGDMRKYKKKQEALKFLNK